MELVCAGPSSLRDTFIPFRRQVYLLLESKSHHSYSQRCLHCFDPLRNLTLDEMVAFKYLELAYATEYLVFYLVYVGEQDLDLGQFDQM